MTTTRTGKLGNLTISARTDDNPDSTAELKTRVESVSSRALDALQDERIHELLTNMLVEMQAIHQLLRATLED